MLDVYVCPMNHEFAVKDGQEPNWCPFCADWSIEFSHEVKDLTGEIDEEFEEK